MPPGSKGEHSAQRKYGNTRRAAAFYARQMLDHLNPGMIEFIGRQEMMFISTADGAGACDCSFRAGIPGFVRVLGEKTLAYPEYRGNGVTASIGNLLENGQIGLIFVDFFASTVGLHVNGRAVVLEDSEMLVAPKWRATLPAPIADPAAERWIMVTVEEAYIHCSKHVPRLQKLDKKIHWNTDNEKLKGGDFFQIRKGARSPEANA